MRVLMITSEWPTPEHPEWAPFLVTQVKSLRDAGVTVDVFSFRGEKNPWHYWQAWMALRRQYSLTDYDLIHAQYGQSGIIALPSKVPLIVTFHGSDLQGIVTSRGKYVFKGKVLQAISRFVARRASAVIIVSVHLKKFLPSEIPVHVIPCGVDFRLFQPTPQVEARVKLKLPLEKKIVLFPARPDDPVKRYALARKVVDKISTQMDVRLLTLDNIPHEKVPLYLNASDALLLTSFHEGSPTVVKEALACNLPIVSVDVGDVRDRLSGIAGCYVSDDSTEALLENLLRVLHSNSRVDGRDAIHDLDHGSIKDMLLDVYQSVL